MLMTYHILQDCVPDEIIGHVMLYMASPTATLIRESKYFDAPFPFLYLRKLSYVYHDRYPIPPSYADCLAYYQYDVYWTIVQWQHPVVRGRYRMNFIHCSGGGGSTEDDDEEDPLSEYSRNIGIDLEHHYTMYMNTVYHRLLRQHMRRYHTQRHLQNPYRTCAPVFVPLCAVVSMCVFVLVTLFVFTE